jgi:HD-like signal output (HDOD) protein
MPTAAVLDPEVIVRDAIKNLNALSTLPETTNKIIAAVEDPKSSAGRLHKIIIHDPSLATRILKIVNSAFYGLPGQITSVERAIVLLGLNAVKNIAVAASLGQMFRAARLCEGYSASDLWTHCVAVGIAARDLARELSLPGTEEAFVSGMIHDVGILVELQIWPEQLRAICSKVKAQGGDFCEAERQALGVDHQMLGKALADKWKFPQAFQQVAGCHHNPALAGEHERTLTTLVYVADVSCCKIGKGFSLTAGSQELDMQVVEEAGIDQEMIDRVMAKLDANLAAAVTVLS